MDDFQNPQVQAHASSVVLNFNKNWTPDILTPYLDGIVSKLLFLLQNRKQMVQEGDLIALASVADSSQESLMGFMMSRIQHWMCSFFSIAQLMEKAFDQTESFVNYCSSDECCRCALISTSETISVKDFIHNIVIKVLTACMVLSKRIDKSGLLDSDTGDGCRYLGGQY
ncbi:hypothetical protein MKX01_035021 [Papaver californicum]|nr:hypothetical protein MKX01_035021 [Papaver californicum]